MSQTATSPKVSPKRSLNALALLLLGIGAVSFAAIFIRISEQEIGPYATVAHRFGIATVMLTLWELGKRFRNTIDRIEDSASLSTIDWGLLLLAGLISGIDLALWALSLTQTSIANAAALSNLAPLFTALGSWVLWKQGFERRYWTGLALALGGAFTIGFSDLQLGQWQGDAIALSSAILFSVYLLILEQLRKTFSATVILLSCSAIAAGITSAIALAIEDHFFPQSWVGWLSVIGLAIMSQTIGQGLVTYSLQQLSSGIVAMTFLLEPAIAAVLAWLIFSETLDWINLLGFLLIILGVYRSISGPSNAEEAA